MKICDFGLSISGLVHHEKGGTLPYMPPESLKMMSLRKVRTLIDYSMLTATVLKYANVQLRASRTTFSL